MVRRQCGDCTLCCKLLPVNELDKPAGQRCKHQRHGKGCSIYPRRPDACAKWFCRWLINDDMDDLRRPDRARYVVDLVADYVTIRVDDERGERINIPAVQVWCDPAHPDAHRDPALRAWLLRNGQSTPLLAVVRYSERDAIVLLPPTMTSTGEWIEHTSGVVDGGHSFEEIQMVWKGEM